MQRKNERPDFEVKHIEFRYVFILVPMQKQILFTLMLNLKIKEIKEINGMIFGKSS
jgi:hypothetical protein